MLQHLEWISDQLTILVHAFPGERLTEECQDLYCADLAEFSRECLAAVFHQARRESKFFPRIAELRQMATTKERERTAEQEIRERLEERKRLETGRAAGDVLSVGEVKNQLAQLLSSMDTKQVFKPRTPMVRQRTAQEQLADLARVEKSGAYTAEQLAEMRAAVLRAEAKRGQ